MTKEDINITSIVIPDDIDSTRIWFTADSHFMHGNIIRLCNRPFSNLREMEEEMVSKWNSNQRHCALQF